MNPCDEFTPYIPKLVFEAQVKRFEPSEQGFLTRVFHGDLGHIVLVTGTKSPIPFDPQPFFTAPCESGEIEMDEAEELMAEQAVERLNHRLATMTQEDRAALEKRISDLQAQEDALVDAEWGFFSLGMCQDVADAIGLSSLEDAVWITEGTKYQRGKPLVFFSRIMLESPVGWPSVPVLPISVQEVSLLCGLAPEAFVSPELA